MSQSTLDEDELFGEAANEVREDVEASLEQASEALPETDDIWTIEADNTLGALNGLRSALDTGDAADHLRDAKKWYTMGTRADAFEEADDLEADIHHVEEAIEDIEEAKEQVGELASTIPGLKNTLEDLQTEADEDEEADADDSADGEDADDAEDDTEEAEAAE